ncbi:hypothetical protein [Pedobacter nototheniae]|uniref:hypothetical protein n=1 Tax=Pedobacter nototheniae TaxID=2488994 RepID=UPI002930B6DB|nr:hypothetical protein [Pedobacter nototheniae]
MNYRSLLSDESAAPEEQKAFVALENKKTGLPVQFTGNHGLTSKFNKKGERKNYGLTILTQENSAENEIKYELAVTCLGINEESTISYQIERTGPVYINELEPDLVADKLAYEAGKIFYPLTIETDKEGRFLGVKNINEIRKRWPKAKEKITDYFEGEYVSKYLGLMEERLADDDFIQLIFRDDWFIKVYFQAIYRNYTETLTVEEYLNFPILQPWVSGYKTIEKVNQYTNHFGSVEVNHQGELIQDEENSMTGNYEARYVLNAASKAIQIIIAEWTCKDLTEKRIVFKLFTRDGIETGNVQTNISPSEVDSLVFIDGRKNTGKTSFWEKWF